eukprot:746213-Hanusia_phi.AAC.1
MAWRKERGGRSRRRRGKSMNETCKRVELSLKRRKSWQEVGTAKHSCPSRSSRTKSPPPIDDGNTPSS